MARQQEYSETLTLTYESDNQRADAQVVGESLLAFHALIAEVRTAVKENEQLLVKARPFAPGSLELPIDLIVLAAAIVFQEHPLLQQIRKVVSEYLDIKRRLRGRPINIEDGNIITIDNSPIHVNHITLQCLDPGSTVSNKFSEAFHAIENDHEIHAVHVSSSKVKDPLIRIPREEFPYFHPETPIGEQNLGQRQEESRETLIIRQPAFDAELAWRFIWRGTKISGMIQDPKFLKDVESGRESFAAGDSLDVDLKRFQEYDPMALTYVDRQYTITHVREHNRRDDQGNLFS